MTVSERICNALRTGENNAVSLAEMCDISGLDNRSTRLKDSEYGDSFALMLVVIVSGAKFVIDGPEILTKLFGIDGGTKSFRIMSLTTRQTMPVQR